jgi:hypothetical protein
VVNRKPFLKRLERKPLLTAWLHPFIKKLTRTFPMEILTKGPKQRNAIRLWKDLIETKSCDGVVNRPTLMITIFVLVVLVLVHLSTN